MTSFTAWCTKALASCAFLSYGPNAWRRNASREWRGAGLIGSVAGVLSAPILPSSLMPLLSVLAGGLAISVAVSDYAEELFAEHDDPRIVIDEWIGTWVAVAWCPHPWPVLLVGLVLFRVFDVWKPTPCAWLANFPGGWGVVLDDVMAGVYANLALHVLIMLCLFGKR